MLTAAARARRRSLVRPVDDVLVTRVGVDRGHQAFDDAERVVEHLHERHDAVGRAAGVRDHLVLADAEVLVVDAVHERGVGSGAGRRDDHERCAGVEVCARGVTRVEEAGRFDHDVDTEFAPWQIGRVALAEHGERVVADLDPALDGLDVVGQHTEHRVVLEEVRHLIDRSEVVHRDEVDVGALRLGCTEEVPTDPTEAVDTDANCHVGVPLVWCLLGDHMRRTLRGSVADTFDCSGPGRAALKAQRETSRWFTRTATPRSRSRPANSSAMATERCRPPVHPMATVR